MILGEGEQCFEFPFMTEIAPAFTVELKKRQDAGRDRRRRRQLHLATAGVPRRVRCSDERLNRIWKASRWAVQICLQTHHLDSPNHQEPISDPGDYVIEAMVNDYAFAQPWLTRQDIRKFAWLLKDEKYHNFHTSYSIAWLQMLMDYYDYTGDRAARRGNGPLRARIAGHLRLVAGQERADLRGPQLHVHGLGRYRRLRLPSSAGRDRPRLPHGVLLPRPGNGVARGGR